MVGPLEQIKRLLNDTRFTELNRSLTEFNLFNAVGMTWQEIRHSRFLSELLNPSGAHGLGEAFLRSWLQIAASRAGVSWSSHLDAADLSSVLVTREQHRIDVLISDKRSGIVCAIENKILAGEHGDQLDRYAEALQHHFPEQAYPYRLLVLLSPHGWTASNRNFIAMGYETICASIERVLATAGGIKPDVAMALRHYERVLRTHVMDDPALLDLCRSIYRDHRAAIDRIVQAQGAQGLYGVTEHLIQLIDSSQTHGIVAEEHAGRSIIRFADVTLDQAAWMKHGPDDWVESRRSLLFEFHVRRQMIRLDLVVGTLDPSIRAALTGLCVEPPFLVDARNSRWQRIFRESMLDAEDFERLESGDVSADDLLGSLSEAWDHFVRRTLPRLRDGLQSLSWSGEA